ncbi:hypothetical protein Tco_0434535 [Tanacetum coccineum]
MQGFLFSGPKHIDDEIVAEDQPGAEDASPTAQSPGLCPGEMTETIRMSHQRRIEDLMFNMEVMGMRGGGALVPASLYRREDRPEVTLPPRKRLGIALGPGYEVGESLSASAARLAGGLRADYGFVATIDREIRRDPERDWIWDHRLDTDEVYTRLDDEQSQRQLLAGRLNILFRDRHAHARTARLMKTEARMSREACGRSMDASDLARAEAVISEMLKADQRRSAEMRELRTTDHTRQHQLIQTLTVMQSLQGQVTALQGHVTALQGQQGPVGGPTQPELPEEAGSSS